MKNEESGIFLSTFVDQLQAQGRYVFTLQEARALPGQSIGAIRQSLQRLKRAGRIVSPRRGFYAIVPLEYRAAGAPPASWFIDDLMRHLAKPYYAGLLTAAALHGAAHQQPMAFQVVTDRMMRPSRAGRARIEFRAHRLADKVPVVTVQTETGGMRVSTPEATAFDLVRYAHACGGFGNVATVFKELSEKIIPEKLPEVAPLYALSDAQRLGYLLEAIGKRRFAAPLRESLSRRAIPPIPLVPGRNVAGRGPDPRWNVVTDEIVEADL